MIWIYIWEPNGPNIGHASAKIADVKNAYISWWPREQDKPLKDSPGGVGTYDSDGAVEGRPPDWRTTIQGLNEQGGLKWWRSFSKDGIYNATSTNCAWAVATFLKKSGGDDRVPWWRKADASPKGKSVGGHLLDATMYGPLYNSARDLIDFARVIGGDSGGQASFADRNMYTWTPADVRRYVNLIKD